MLLDQMIAQLVTFLNDRMNIVNVIASHCLAKNEVHLKLVAWPEPARWHGVSIIFSAYTSVAEVHIALGQISS